MKDLTLNFCWHQTDDPQFSHQSALGIERRR